MLEALPLRRPLRAVRRWRTSPPVIVEAPAWRWIDARHDALNRRRFGVSLARTWEMDVMAVLETTRPDAAGTTFRLLGAIEGVVHLAALNAVGGAVQALSLRPAPASPALAAFLARMGAGGEHGRQ